MARFTVKTTSGYPTADLDFVIEIPEAAGREYTTVVNAGFAMVLAQAGAILIDAERDQDMKKALDNGMAMVQAIGK
jgi:hypothetical protein